MSPYKRLILGFIAFAVCCMAPGEGTLDLSKVRAEHVRFNNGVESIIGPGDPAQRQSGGYRVLTYSHSQYSDIWQEQGSFFEQLELEDILAMDDASRAELLRTLRLTNLSLFFHDLGESLKDDPLGSPRDLSFFSELIPFIDLRFDPTSPKSFVSQQAQRIAEVEDQDTRDLFIELLARSVYTNAIYLSEMGRSSLLVDFDKEISAFKTAKFDGFNSPELQAELKAKKDARRDLARSADVSLDSLVSAVNGAIPGTDFRGVLERIAKQAETTFRWRGLQVREGDFYLDQFDQGFGGFMYPLINRQHYFVHGAAVAHLQVNWLKTYAILGMEERVKVRSLDKLHGSGAFFRPRAPVRPGFTQRGLNNLLKRGEPRYNATFRDVPDGDLHSNKVLSLYCTQFLHLLWSTEFDPEPSARFPSPMDGLSVDMSTGVDQWDQNLSRLGFDPHQQIYLPQDLLLNRRVDFLGSARHIPSDDIPGHKARQVAYQEMIDYFRNKLSTEPIREKSLMEILDTKFRFNVVLLLSKFVRQIDFPEGKSKLYLLDAFGCPFRYQSLVEDAVRTNKGPINPSSLGKTCAASFTPQIDNLFPPSGSGCSSL